MRLVINLRLMGYDDRKLVASKWDRLARVFLLNILGGLHCRFMWGDRDGCAVWYSHRFGKRLFLDVGSQTVANTGEQSD